MDDLIQPYAYVALRLPSDTLKVQQIIPNTAIPLGKFGAFQANHIIGRPYHLTFEILDKVADGSPSSLRVVSAAELHEHIREDEQSQDASMPPGIGDGVEYEVVNPEGKVVMRTNRDIMDDGESQKLSAEDIEILKREETGSGKDLIAKILESHTTLEKKNAFALAKYTLRKKKKYLKRFTVFPLDVAQLSEYLITEKEPRNIMELREETLALILSWSNVHCGGQEDPSMGGLPSDPSQADHNRLLVVDETGGLIVAAMAERMGILHPTHGQANETKVDETAAEDETDNNTTINGNSHQESDPKKSHTVTTTSQPTENGKPQPDTNDTEPQTPTNPSNPGRWHEAASFTTDNTITILHPASQPNLSILAFFSYDPGSPLPSHPLHKHLKALSWLQLVSPHEDSGYQEPAVMPASQLAALKSGKRGAYYRKRRRWARTFAIVEETRAGNFAALVVASAMAPAGILHHTVPLLRGGAQVVVFSPSIEPLVELMDYYSTARRAAFLNHDDRSSLVPSEEFPVDPTLLLAAAIHTAKARPWQVLPGRTHPLMTGRGGAEGYIFVATRVLPADGKVEARGAFKRRKMAGDGKGEPSGLGNEANVVESRSDGTDDFVMGSQEDGKTSIQSLE